MKRTAYSLRRRLMTALLLVFALGLAASGMIFLQETHQTTSALRERTVRQQARELLAGITIDRGIAIVTLPAAWAKAYRRRGSDFAYSVFDDSGRAVARSGNLDRPLPYLAVPDGERFGPLQITGPEGRALLAARAPEGHVLVVSRTNPDRDALAETLMEENSEPLLVLIGFIGAAILFTWLVAGWSLRPISRAARDAAAIAPGNPDARIAPARLPAEVLPLVDAVNGALDRLAHAYEAERRFTADAAHELRTPLAVLSLRLQRAEIDGTPDWPAIRRDLAELGRLVGQLLDLARKEAADRAAPATDAPPVDLGRTVREAAAAVVPLVESAGRALDVDAPAAALPVRGRTDDLRDMVRNLLDNAVEHGCGAITVRLLRHGRDAVLEVEDEGCGIPPNLRDTVFERFRKGRPDSAGAGLGLAIVRQVARAHGGDARLIEEHASCRIQVLLPVAAADDRGTGRTDSRP